MRAYSVELRTRIVDAVDRGVGSLPKVAALFRVSVGYVTNYLHLRARTLEELIDTVGEALLAITTDDIRGWFEHCGEHTDS